MFLSFLFSRPYAHAITGKWIDADAAPDGAEYGFILLPGGVAKSVNAASPQYTSWRAVGDILTLYGHTRTCCGNDRFSTNIDFTESMNIQELTPVRLVLRRANSTSVFLRG